MKVSITEAHELRDALLENITEDGGIKNDLAAQHDVWPCVRKGAGARWYEKRGVTFKLPKSSALYFLRGKSAEALIAPGQHEAAKLVEYKGVAGHPDLDEDVLAFMFPNHLDKLRGVKVGEIKSTNFSSYTWYQAVKEGGIDLGMNRVFKMRNYLEQSANYAVATGTSRTVLIIFFLHGDYADRRTTCPECRNRLGDWDNKPGAKDGFFRECSACGYKSKKLDLWVYFLDFDDDVLADVDREVYTVRAGQFYAAQNAPDEASLMSAAPGTPCFYCRDCAIGKRLGCEHAGKEYD